MSNSYSNLSTGEQFDSQATYECGCGAKMCRHFDGDQKGGCKNPLCELACETCFPAPSVAVAAAAPGLFDRLIATVDRVLSKVSL